MNKTIRTLIKYEWKAFVRNKFQLWMLALTFMFGLYAIYYGQSEINAQKETIKSILILEHDEFSQYKASFSEEMHSLKQEQTHDVASRPSFAWYRHGYHAILPPHDFAPLAIGQRDLFRYYYRLTGSSLHYQLFENELANPVNLKAGNFDLSFLIIYLFPLLIIAFCYGLYSVEKELGILPLLQIQAISIRKIILIRFGFYFTLVTGFALFISSIGLLTSANPFTKAESLPALVWILGVIVYCGFWFSLMFLIVSFRRSSSFNTTTAAACWLFFLIVIPSLLNVIVTVKYPLSSTTLAELTRRTGLENEEDEDEAREVISEFLAHKPDLAGSDSLVRNNLMPKAYAAFTTLKDINSQKKVDHYNAQVTKRNLWTSQFLWLSPAANMQEIFSHLAETDLNTFLHFQKSLEIFHEQITDFYFSRLFWDKPIFLDDYSNLPVFKIPEIEDRWAGIWPGIGQISFTAALVFWFGFIKIKDGPL